MTLFPDISVTQGFQRDSHLPSSHSADQRTAVLLPRPTRSGAVSRGLGYQGNPPWALLNTIMFCLLLPSSHHRESHPSKVSPSVCRNSQSRSQSHWAVAPKVERWHSCAGRWLIGHWSPLRRQTGDGSIVTPSCGDLQQGMIAGQDFHTAGGES